MLIEQARRSLDFRAGTSILLADGQSWTLPEPTKLEDGMTDISGRRSGRAEADNGYLDLLRAIGEAEDQAELVRAELALAIHLLSQNYDLRSEDYRLLLGFELGSPGMARMQRKFHEVAMEHWDQARPGLVAAADSWRCGGSSPTLSRVGGYMRRSLLGFLPGRPAKPVGGSY